MTEGDLTAPTGAVNTGAFLLSGEWYGSDPFAGGEFLDFAADRAALYVPTVTAPPDAPVPEPSALLLSASGVTWLVGRAGRRGGGAAEGMITGWCAFPLDYPCGNIIHGMDRGLVQGEPFVAVGQAVECGMG
jgi:hypothetical protein